MEYKEYNFESFRLLTIKTNRFKNCHIEMNFLEDVYKVNRPLRNFLLNSMEYSTLKYKKKRDLLIRLEELYNSSYTTSCFRLGKNFISTFALDFLDPIYTNDKKYLEDCLSFLVNCIKNLNFKDNELDERTFEIIKEKIHSKIDRYKESALNYAMVEAKKVLFDDPILKERIIGTHEDIDNLTRKDVYEEYKRMITNSKLDIVIIGNLDMDKVAEYLKKQIDKKTIVELEPQYFCEPKIKPYKRIEIESNFNQTQVLFCLQFDNISEYEREIVSIVYRSILANANTTDKLTQYLRKENSLVYYQGLRPNLPDKNFIIYTGTSYNKVNECEKLIKKALKEMEDGKIEENYFEEQKEKIISDLQMSEDSEYSIVDEYYFHKILGIYTTKEKTENIKKVTIDDVKAFAKKLHLSLIFVLKENTHERN